MEFWKIYRLVKARRWLILGLLLITLLTVFVAKKAVDEQTQYSATAVVLPDLQAMSPQGVFQDATGRSLTGPTYDRFARMAMFTQSITNQFDTAINLASQPTLVQKQAMVRALANQLSAAQAQNFKWHGFPQTHGLSEKTLDEILTYFQVPTDDSIWVPRDFSSAAMQAAKADMQGSLSAQPIINTTVNPGDSNGVITDYLQIGLHAPDPTLAEQVANLVAAAFINNYHSQGIQEYNNGINMVREAQQQARQQLNQAYSALINFERKNPLVNVSASVSSGIGNMVGLQRSLESAQQQQYVATKEAAALSQLAQRAGTALVTPMTPQARPQVIQLQGQIADLEAQVNTMAGQYTPLNPKMQMAQQALKAKKKELKQLLAEPYVDASPNSDYIALKQQANQELARAASASAMITSLKQQIAQQEAQNKTLPAQQKTLAELTDDLTAAQMNKKQADANVVAMTQSMKMLNQGLISLDAPAVNASPDQAGPGLVSLLIYGAILSLILGIAIAVGLDYLDNSVQTIPDAEKLLGMPVSAVIPAMPAGDPRRMTRLTVSDPLSPIAEAYRLLRTDLLFTAEEKPFQSLMAATAKPGQGATTTICNLAVALATVGKRVILIDADLRRPKLHAFFNVSNETGLTSLLRDECELEEALKVTDIDNLLVLPSGPLPLNPAELLASQKMRALHERLKPHTDFVLVDTPSAIAFSDSSILASYLDAVMIVVRAQETPRGSEMQLKNLLNKARANVVGVVLNGVKPQLVDSYFYHAAYYPQVSPGNVLNGGSGGILPPPSNGHGTNGTSRTHDNDGHTRTLDRDQPNDELDEEDIESTAVMGDDIVSVTPPEPRPRFSIRKMFGTDNRDE